MSADADARLAYLVHSVDVLWPGLGHDAGAPMVVLPSTRAPRVLAPRRPRRAAASAVRHYTAQQGRADRAAGGVLAGAVLAGFGSLLPPVRATGAAGTDTIDDHLSEVLSRPVVTSLALTRDRPNRKPVLQVFDARGATIAFAKVGISPLAADLVDAEARALSQLGTLALPGVEVPRVLGYDRWHGHPVLVASALVPGAAVPAGDPDLDAAMRAVAAATTGDLDAYLAGMHARADAADASEWRELFGELLAARDLSGVPVGAWHGDWTTWNCARHGGRIVVWDWERFGAPVPLGFDKLHFVLNDAVAAHRDRFRAAATDLVDDAATHLTGWGLSPADATSVALLYVMDVALRYVADDARSSDPGGKVEQWALPTVRAALTTRAHDTRRGTQL